jgi:thermitase
VRVVLALSLLVLAGLAPAAQAATAPTRIVVARDPGLSATEKADIRHDAGVSLLHTLRIPNTEVVTTHDPKAALAALDQDPDVRYAQVDQLRHAFSTDPDFSSQWGLQNTGTNLAGWYYINPDGSHTPVESGIAGADMNVPTAWATATGTGVKVAIVDTIVNPAQPDLARNIVGSGDFVTGGTAATASTDERDHGNHVAGIVAAVKDNGIDTAGVAPTAELLTARALDDTGSGYDSDIANAFDWAATQGARVVNASLGGPDGDGAILGSAILRHPDTLFVVAAGNDGTDNDTTAQWPCNVAAPNVICVGASTSQDTRASFSNYGAAKVDLFAPGQNIMSTLYAGDDGLMSGTSMASPMVAGVAALVLSEDPSLTALQAKAIILQTGDAKSAFARKSVSGRRADAAAAVAMAAAGTVPADANGDGVPDTLQAPVTPTPTPTPAPSPIPTPAPVSTPIPTPAPPADRDGDGRPDSSDLCPGEYATTITGCPVPGWRSLKAKLDKRHHRVKVTVATSRAATVTIKLQRRVCNAKGKHCKWRTVSSVSKASRGDRAVFTSRKLARGRYRLTVRLASPAGRSTTRTKTLKV